MKTTLTVLITLLLAISSSAQNGINYKAVIKDGSGNIVTNQNVTLQISIIEGVAQDTFYIEVHSVMTDNNGIAIVTIGEGTEVLGTYEGIDWTNKPHSLQVVVDLGNGGIDMGTTTLETVPYAKVAENVSGLEALDEGGGTGWRLIDRNPSNYGNIGIAAVDLSVSFSESTTNGATNVASFASGSQTSASGEASTAMGLGSDASGLRATAIGSFAEASGDYSVAMGSATTASGYNSTAFGFVTRSDAFMSTSIGQFNVGGGNPTSWVATDPIFEIGNGTSGFRNNALTVLKSGFQLLNSSTSGMRINSESAGLIVDSEAIGILIFSPEGEGIIIDYPGGEGIIIDSPGAEGITVVDPVSDGIRVATAGSYGGHFTGELAGVFTENDNDNNGDLLLGGSDGIIQTDSAINGADMFLKSHDAVEINLDIDNNEAGNFRVRNGTGTNVFDVNESGTVRVNGSIVHSSDKRLKEDISDLSYGLEEILLLQPKSYYWKNQEQIKKSFGLIAQDVQPIIEEIVNIQDDEVETLGVSYTELIPVLINAIKEQQNIIDNQSQQIQQYKGDFKLVFERLEALEKQSSN